MTALRKSTLNYVYDFGDYWEHRIKVEKTLVPVPGLELPFCVAGACATPPENCGGVPGYVELVQAMADPGHPEDDNVAEWIGLDTWDATAFDSTEVNDCLAGIKL